MLNIGMIESFLLRVGQTDVVMANAVMDPSGDLLTIFDPDSKFETVRDAVYGYRPYRINMVDNGLTFIEVTDTVYVDGNKVNVSVLITPGELGYGLTVKMMVKSIDYVTTKGEVRSFLGFDALRDYQERFEVQ